MKLASWWERTPYYWPKIGRSDFVRQPNGELHGYFWVGRLNIGFIFGNPISKTESFLVDLLIYGTACICFVLFCWFIIPKVF